MPVNPTVFTPEPITTTPQVYVDGEDLIITTENSNEVVKLSDRVATTTESIKQGYKRVRQDAVLNTAYFQANTTYEFMYHHDLDDETITFPTGVILNFNGGKLDNGTLVGNHTAIVAPITLIFKKDLKIDKDGTWNIDRAYSDWFECYKNGYYIDPTTFVEDRTNPELPVRTYEYNNVVYNAGDLCGATYNNDRHILQQLLNLSANHTIISEGIYMVDSAGGSGDNPDNQLIWFKKKGLTLQIDGTLKLIPNSYTNYTILLVAECDNIKVCGSGKLVGDLPEHQGTGGEAGMCLQVNSTQGLYLEGLTLEQGWGDGVYYSWRRYYSLTDKNNQVKHYWNNVKCLYNRRTGFVVERGDYLTITNSEFSYTGIFNGKATFSGVDVEPFGENSAKQRFCKEIHFDKCTANYNSRGEGFRFERVVGGSIKNCEASFNNVGISLIGCGWGSVDRHWEDEHSELDRIFVQNRIVLDTNTLKNNYDSAISSNSTIYVNPDPLAPPVPDEYHSNPSSAIILNNFIQNCGSVIIGPWRNTIVENNNIYNTTRSIFYLHEIIDNFKFINNTVYGIDAPDDGNNSAIFTIRYSGSYPQYKMCRDVLIKDNLFKYAGGKIIHGSNDNTPMPYPTVKNYLFFMDTLPSGILPENFNRVKYVNNKFADELWAPASGELVHYTVYGDENVMQQERTLTLEDIGTMKHLMQGDKLNIHGQIGLVTTSGWLDVVGVEFVPGSTWYEKNQIVYKDDRSAMFVATNAGNAGTTYPAGFGVTDGSTPIYARPINVAPPVIEWQGIGTCTSTTRPSGPLAFNTLGRRLIETDTGDMIMWDGTAWVVI